VLRVTDDGIGLGESKGSGLGVHNLAERAAVLGGEYVLRPRPEGGTEVLWRVPLSPR
jgi:signal transduction histidine kinase